MFRCFSQIVAFAVVMIFCFLPSMFCKLRYTTGRCKTIREHYREMKHPGRNLLKIVLISIALAVANTRTDVSPRIYTLGMTIPAATATAMTTALVHRYRLFPIQRTQIKFFPDFHSPVRRFELKVGGAPYCYSCPSD